LTHTSEKTASAPALWATKALRTGLVALAACSVLSAEVFAAQQRAGGRTNAGGGSLVDAPEINPKLLIGMAVLLVGGVLVLTARRRRRARLS
jgi:hypothetical protein